MSAGNRTVAVLAARVARKRLDVVAQSIEANRWPMMVDVLRALVDAVEGILADPQP
jgi:hypothetical protein